MKTRMFFVAIAVAGLLGAAGYGLYTIGMNQGMKLAGPDNGAQKASDAGADAGRKVLYWHDPMAPGQKFDKPGKSPFMDMPLVPVYADGDSDSGNVSISSRMQQNLGVRTAQVTTGTLTQHLAVPGSVAYNERDVTTVTARVNGYVERLHVRAQLDPVRKGQALAELFAPDWVAAQEEYLSVRRMKGAGTDALVSAARQRMLLAGMSEDQALQVESAGKVESRYTLNAPMGGVITELGAREGMTVTAGALLFRINGLGSVWIYAEIPESAAAAIHPGTSAEARTPALPGKVFKGRVAAILPEVNAATRTLKARVEIANAGGALVPGMFVNVDFAPAAGNNVLLVPSEAVIDTGKRKVVIAELDAGKFQAVDVETGVEANGQTEIRKGLVAGQKVVVSGQFLIDSEASLKSATTRMSDVPMAKAAEAAQTHRATAKVEAIHDDAVTLSHGAVPSLKWESMTMDFKLPAAGLPKNISKGDAVEFEFRLGKDGQAELISIAPAKPDATGAKK